MSVLKKKISEFLAHPDPAVLGAEEQQQQELERLCQLPISVLSPTEALTIIWRKRLEYGAAKQLYRKWWDSVDPDVQRRINLACESFESQSDYEWQLIMSGGPVLNATQATLGLNSRYRDFQQRLPKISQEQYLELGLVAKDGRTTLHRGRQRRVVNISIERFLSATRTVLQAEFGVVQNRPMTQERRDRQLSAWKYEGLSDLEIVRQWNKAHPGSLKLLISKEIVQKQLRRYRRKREPLTWKLRVFIYQSNFPVCRRFLPV
jgi:hypothetical protein